MSPEFLPFCERDGKTLQGAQLFQVAPDRFINWRWQMGRQLAAATDVPRELRLSTDEEESFAALKPYFHAGITPYYATLMDRDPVVSCPIRLQAMPQMAELHDAKGMADPLQEVGHSPVKEVVQVYPDRVAFCVAQLCPVYCRYCFRKRRDEEEGLHFNRAIIERGLAYIASRPAIRDVLITGGDPFIASDEAILQLVERLRQIPHVAIIRFGTRTPVTLPYRVTAALAKELARFHPIYVNTHFNCAEELTPEAGQAVANLVDHGIPVGNQSVLLRGVNDTPERLMDLCFGLLKFRVKPYYLFHPHLVAGTEHLRVSLEKGVRLMQSLRGNVTGLAIPEYVLDTPSGKVPVGPQHLLRREGEDAILCDVRGEIWREKHAFKD